MIFNCYSSICFFNDSFFLVYLILGIISKLLPVFKIFKNLEQCYLSNLISVCFFFKHKTSIRKVSSLSHPIPIFTFELVLIVVPYMSILPCPLSSIYLNPLVLSQPNPYFSVPLLSISFPGFLVSHRYSCTYRMPCTSCHSSVFGSKVVRH